MVGNVGGLHKKNVILEFIHIMLMGASQVALNTNPICAVILLIAV